MLQAAIRLRDFRNIVELAQAAQRLNLPRECYVRVPLTGDAQKTNTSDEANR